MGKRKLISEWWQGAITAILVIALIKFAVFVVANYVETASYRAHRMDCTNNLKRIGLAMKNYHDRHGRFPAGASFDERGRPLLSWRVMILPFLDQEDLYREFHLNEPWYSPHNKTLLGKMPKAFACPLNESRNGDAGLSPYQVIVGPPTMFTGDPTGVRLDEVTDRTDATILVVETSDTVPWTAPHDVAFDRASILAVCGSGYHGALRAAMADGSVQYIKSTVDPGILWSLMTRNGGEVIDPKMYEY